jgi:peptide-methionine (S)-S-oxide reductase
MRRTKFSGMAVGLFIAAIALAPAADGLEAEMNEERNEGGTRSGERKVAFFGGGCFWCVEAFFERVPGVTGAVSGYQGGHVKDPTYRQVCTGETGHAEVVRVEYDPSEVSYDELLEVFWAAHDPTQRNRQGADVGTQYRSVIYAVDEEQRRAAEASKRALQASGRIRGTVVTQIEPAGPFYEAEVSHQDYYAENPGAPYCRYVIEPKLRKAGFAE